MLELRGVVVEERLDRCSFAARPGEVLGLVGGSASGKSSALSVAAGLVPPRRGRVLLDERDANPARLRRAVGLAGHSLPGPHDIDGLGWLRLWAQLDGVPRAEFGARADAALERFGIRPGSEPVGVLSRGYQRRLNLIRLWLRDPPIYLLDAPGDGLDGDGLRRLTAAVREVAAQGRTVLLADASPHLPTSLCDRVVCLTAGAVTREAARADPDFGQHVAAAQGWAL
jgi:ABC-type multidrug transport system ATPase subunit